MQRKYTIQDSSFIKMLKNDKRWFGTARPSQVVCHLTSVLTPGCAPKLSLIYFPSSCIIYASDRSLSAGGCGLSHPGGCWDMESTVLQSPVEGFTLMA